MRVINRAIEFPDRTEYWNTREVLIKRASQAHIIQVDISTTKGW
jgi:hypothetical protein